MAWPGLVTAANLGSRMVPSDSPLKAGHCSAGAHCHGRATRNPFLPPLPTAKSGWGGVYLNSSSGLSSGKGILQGLYSDYFKSQNSNVREGPWRHQPLLPSIPIVRERRLGLREVTGPRSHCAEGEVGQSGFPSNVFFRWR